MVLNEIYGQYMCEVSSLYAKRKWSYRVEMEKTLKSKCDLDLWPFDLKINRGPPWVMVNTCVNSKVSSLYVKRKSSYPVEMVQSLKSEFDLDLWPQNQ